MRAWLVFLVILSGCVPPSTSMQGRQLTSALVVQAEERTTVYLKMVSVAQQHCLIFSDALGLVHVKVAVSGDHYRIDHHDFTEAEAELWVQEQLGVKLPLSSWFFWVLGQSDPQMTTMSNQPMRLVQQGWQVDYERMVDTPWGALPEKMMISHDQYRVTLPRMHWRAVDDHLLKSCHV